MNYHLSMLGKMYTFVQWARCVLFIDPAFSCVRLRFYHICVSFNFPDGRSHDLGLVHHKTFVV